MKKILLTFLAVILLAGIGKAQDYKTGIGARLSWDLGLTVKHFISEKSALEGILATRWSGFQITGLYEINNRIESVDRLNWFIGGGAHIGFYGNSSIGASGTFLGLDGIIGLEYNFKEVPISISADWKPAFTFGYNYFGYDGGALSVRYIF